MISFFTLTTFAVLISICDIISFRIPNILLAGMVLTLTGIDVINHSYFLLFISFVSAIVLFALFFLIFRFIGGLGFGDVKYAAVIGYALGFQKALYACLAASLMGILFFAVFYFIAPHNKKTVFKREQKIPFGPFLSFGLILFSLDGLI